MATSRWMGTSPARTPVAPLVHYATLSRSVGLEGREWVGDGDEQPGRDRLRLDLLGAVRAGDERVADGSCGRELDLRRLERSLLGDGGLQRGHGQRQVG